MKIIFVPFFQNFYFSIEIFNITLYIMKIRDLHLLKVIITFEIHKIITHFIISCFIFNTIHIIYILEGIIV